MGTEPFAVVDDIVYDGDDVPVRRSAALIEAALNATLVAEPVAIVESEPESVPVVVESEPEPEPVVVESEPEPEPEPVQVMFKPSSR